MPLVRAVRLAFHDGSRVRLGAVLEVGQDIVNHVKAKAKADPQYRPWFVVVDKDTPITNRSEPAPAGQAPVALSQLAKSQPVKSQVEALKTKPETLA